MPATGLEPARCYSLEPESSASANSATRALLINANYYARVRANGKLIRESLNTKVWSDAKLKLADFTKEQQENRNKADPPKFSEAVEMFKRELEGDTGIKPQSKRYRLWCLGKLQKTWPELWDLRLDVITPQACREWSAKLITQIACHYYNNTLGTLKQVLQVGIKAHRANGGGTLENPVAEIKKTRVKQKELRLTISHKIDCAIQRGSLETGCYLPKPLHFHLPGSVI